jgi:hypothetical protein
VSLLIKLFADKEFSKENDAEGTHNQITDYRSWLFNDDAP